MVRLWVVGFPSLLIRRQSNSSVSVIIMLVALSGPLLCMVMVKLRYHPPLVDGLLCCLFL
jgi:hypothetical protein